ncbi:hypothetical protein JCM19379_20110 [Methyloparacoccus murrellii]
MADDLHTLHIATGDDGNLGITIDDPGKIHQLPVDAAGKRRLGQTSPNGRRHLHERDRMIELPARTVWQRYDRHRKPQGQKKHRAAMLFQIW